MSFIDDSGSEGLPPAPEERALDDQGGAEQIAAPAVHTDRPRESQQQLLMRWSDPRQTLNIADEIDDEELSKIAQDVKQGYDIDVTSRADWLDKSKEAIKLAMQIAEKKSYPWPDASNVIYPLMSTAAIQFAARAYPAIVADRRVVKGVVYGPDEGEPLVGPDGQPALQPGPDGQSMPVWRVPPGAKQARADRIGEHMSYQLLEEQTEWEEDTDKMLHILPIVGCCLRKTYFDPECSRNMSLMVTAENVVVNYWAKSLELAQRISEEQKLYPIEIEEAIRAGLYLEQQYGDPPNAEGDKDAAHEFIEQHRRIDLDDDGYPEPYIVTMHKPTNKIARIVARFDPEGVKFLRSRGTIAKIDPVQYYTKYDFLPNIEGGFYGMGFGQLLKPINEAVDTSLNMLIDAGHRQVVGGGFIGKGLSMHSGSVRFKLGEYKVVNALGSKIREAIVHLEAPGPNAVVFSLLGMLIEAGKEIASVKDVLSGDVKSQTMQPTTLLALIEQGLKVFTGIYKRIHRSAKHEYDKLYRLNRLYLDNIAQYQVGDVWKKITRNDYVAGSGVKPISDPSMVSDMQEMARAQLLTGYQNDPLCNPIEIRRRVFGAAKVPDIDKILVTKMPEPQPDPRMLLGAMELEIKAITGKAAALVDMTKSILNLANADKLADDSSLAWINAQMNLLKTQVEALNARSGQPSESEPGAEAAGSPGGDGGGLPALAPPSGDPLAPGLSPGLPG